MRARSRRHGDPLLGARARRCGPAGAWVHGPAGAGTAGGRRAAVRPPGPRRGLRRLFAQKTHHVGLGQPAIPSRGRDRGTDRGGSPRPAAVPKDSTWPASLPPSLSAGPLASSQPLPLPQCRPAFRRRGPPWRPPR